MAYEFKKLSDVNILEEKKTGLNVLVEDAGEIVKISNDDLNPANYYMVVDTTYHYGKEAGFISPYFQDPISTVVGKFQQGFNKTVLDRGILSSTGITTYNPIGYKIVRQDDGTFDAIVYYNDLHPLYLSSSKNTITLLEGWEEPAPSIPAPATAEVGQVMVVKAVDENGKPTEWEAVNGSYDLVLGSTAATQLQHINNCSDFFVERGSITDTLNKLQSGLPVKVGIYLYIDYGEGLCEHYWYDAVHVQKRPDYEMLCSFYIIAGSESYAIDLCIDPNGVMFGNKHKFNMTWIEGLTEGT